MPRISISRESGFSVHNIPFGVFSAPLRGVNEPVCATRIGDFVVDLAQLATSGFFDSAPTFGFSVAKRIFSQSCLNEFMALGRPAWSEARRMLQSALTVVDSSSSADVLEYEHAFPASAVIPVNAVSMHLPSRIGDYTDFYASKEHATNVGIMFRGKENALMPNWLHLPVGYHGRASSVVVSGTNFHRPCGQTKADDAPAPSHTPSRLLDFELEMGFFVGPKTEMGSPLIAREAKDHIFGFVLLNDWSARDIQKWEYVPLGPFGAKNFCTTISPWVVTLEALEPFHVSPPPQDPAVLPYLKERPGAETSFDIKLSVEITTAKGNNKVVSESNLKYLYWTASQQLAHHSVTGCNMQPGDLLGTGTISGPDPSSFGSLLEITWRGEKSIDMGGDEVRKFLQDGDSVTMRGYCQHPDGWRVGFGECTGKVLPARPIPTE
eukprot:ANDGO_00456.mRNA.1 Fumarylacetoacetase